MVYAAPSAAYSPAARDYFARVKAAGGTVTHKKPIAAYIDALVELGGAYWDTMGTSCLFVGVSFEGCFVPLRDGMDLPTNNNFVSADHNATTGLKSNGTTKYIDSGRNNTADPKNSQSISVYATSFPYSSPFARTYFGGGLGRAGDGSTLMSVSGSFEIFTLSRAGAGTGSGFIATAQKGFFGISRSTAASYTTRIGGATATVVQASQIPFNANIGIFQRLTDRGVDGSGISARLAAYHVGPSLDLPTLETLQSTLIASL